MAIDLSGIHARLAPGLCASRWRSCSTFISTCSSLTSNPRRDFHELLVRLASAEVFEVLIPVVDDGVHVRLVLHGEVQGSVPVEQPHAHVHRAIHQTSLDENRLRLVRFASEQRQFGAPSLLRGHFFDPRDELHLLHLLDGGVGNLGDVEILRRHRHRRSRTTTGGVVLDKTTQTNGAIPLVGEDVLVQGGNVRGDAHVDHGAVHGEVAPRLAYRRSTSGLRRNSANSALRPCGPFLKTAPSPPSGEILRRHRHRRQARPHGVVLDETTQTNGAIPLVGEDVLVQNAASRRRPRAP